MLKNRLEQLITLEDIRPLVAAVPEFNSAVEDFAIHALTEPPRPLVEAWIERFGERDEAFEKLLGVAELSSDMGDFLNRSVLRPGSRVGRRGEKLRMGEAVSVLTLHASKGLEFPVVFVSGAEGGPVPMEREDSDREEERRLLYVGMTRAQDELILLSAKTRVIQGERVSSRPSSFLDAIPEEFLVREPGTVSPRLKLSPALGPTTANRKPRPLAGEDSAHLGGDRSRSDQVRACSRRQVNTQIYQLLLRLLRPTSVGCRTRRARMRDGTDLHRVP